MSQTAEQLTQCTSHETTGVPNHENSIVSDSSVEQHHPSPLPSKVPSPLQAFESYSWSEEKDVVKIYIDFDHADELSDSQIHFNHTVDSLDFQVEREGQTFLFEIDALFDRVKDIVLKRKKNKFILTIHKARPAIWYKFRFD
eukprot:scaffold6852_cov215-Ochromonas_danica.AAC.19